MSDHRINTDDFEYESFDNKRGFMDKIGDSVSSLFSRRSRKNEKADNDLIEFSKRSNDDYELFVDERVVQKEQYKKEKLQSKQVRKKRVKKPPTPFARRVKNIVTYCAIVAVVLIVCVILSLTVLFKTSEYEVSGNTKYTKEQIIDTCGIELNDNIFLANKTSASERLTSKYAYIEEADVSFAIPDTITIHIVEAVPSYLVKAAENEYLVTSAKGRILEQVDSPDKYKLPIFLGNDLKTDVVGGYIEYADEKTSNIINEIVTVFNDNGYKGITGIDATDTANITFTYDGRIKVKIGLPEDISYKVRTAMTIINEKLDINNTNTTEGELNVSVCNTTKKSYFREQSLIEQQLETTPQEKETEPEFIDNDYDGYDDISGEWIEPTEEETKPPVSPEDWYLD